MKKISQKFVQKSRQLRKQGLTHREIAKLLDLGIGTVFHYTKGMSLSLEQKIKLKRRNYLNSLGNLSSTEKLLASRKGGLRRSQLTTKQYTREKISKLLKEFYLKNGRIPFKLLFITMP